MQNVSLKILLAWISRYRLHPILNVQAVFLLIMNELQKTNTSVQVFNNSVFGEVRTSWIKDKPFFCLVDVCRSLELDNPSYVKTRLDQKGVVINYTLTAGGMQNLLFVNEPNLYRCVFQSRKENAIAFQNWIFEDVIPRLMRAGGYGKTLPMTSSEAIAYGYAKALEKISRQRGQILKLRGQLSDFKRKSEEYEERKRQMLLEQRKATAGSVYDFVSDYGVEPSSSNIVAFRDIYAMYCAWCKEKRGYVLFSCYTGQVIKACPVFFY